MTTPRELLRRGAHAPLHHAVYSILRGRLQEGRYPSDLPLPGEHHLSGEFGVSRVTVRRALRQLSDEGWIEKQPGIGTFPSASGNRDLALPFNDYLEYLTKTTAPYKLKLVAYEVIKTPEFLKARKLNLGRRVLKIQRLSLLKAQPVHFLVSYIPGDLAHVVTKRDAGNKHVMSILEAGGVRITHTDLLISAVPADLAVAARLEVAAGSPLIAAQRISVGEDGEPVEFSESYSRPDMFRYRISLDRGNGRANAVREEV
ncbi:MAG: GntR family transcriptional regulator [Rhodospirillaceae bacterium]|nr:GntR family transcriptional regulator [Rhodospirillaceae bacterium]